MFTKLIIIALLVKVHGHQLKQVIVLSRHHIRTPFNFNLELWSPKQLPIWKGSPGDLTPKGRLLEFYMGKYFIDWMIQEELFENNCPINQACVYANTRQRTKESAKSFVEGAFGDCINIYYKNTTEMDPVFNTIIRNTSKEFKEFVINEQEVKLNSINLRKEFLELSRILDFGNSVYCKTENVCDLSEIKNEPVFRLNREPSISGAFGIGCVLVDSFLMAYYDGMAPENIAWGQIQTTQQWNSLMKILKSCYELRLKIKKLDKDLASTLLEYLSDIFMHGEKKFYLLVGHDANIYSLMSTLNFKDYSLSDQFEITPIGGKLVFQKWYDEENDQDLLRIYYVYQSSKQIRDGATVSLQNPPQWQTLEMQNCTTDKKGFCPWNDFITIVNGE